MSEPTIQQVLDANPKAERFVHGLEDGEVLRLAIDSLPMWIREFAVIPGLRPVRKADPLLDLKRFEHELVQPISPITARWAVSQIEEARKLAREIIARFLHVSGIGLLVDPARKILADAGERQ